MRNICYNITRKKKQYNNQQSTANKIEWAHAQRRDATSYAKASTYVKNSTYVETPTYIETTVDRTVDRTVFRET